MISSFFSKLTNPLALRALPPRGRCPVSAGKRGIRLETD